MTTRRRSHSPRRVFRNQGEELRSAVLDEMVGLVYFQQDDYARAAYLEAIPRLGAAAESALLRLLEDRTDPRCRYVPRLLVSTVGAAAAPVLVGLLDDADDEVAMNAATALGSLRDPAFATPLQAIMDGADMLVVGRPVRDAPDPAAAVRGLLREIEDGLRRRAEAQA